MGKDRTSNILYGLGVVGGIMALLGGAYILISGIVWHGTELVPIDRVLLAVGAVLASFAFLGLYRDTGSYLAIIPFLCSNLYQIIGMQLQPYLHQGYFTPAYLIIWSFILLSFGVGGYVVYMTREDIGMVALIAGILSIIWAFLRIGVAYMIIVGESMETTDIALFYFQLRAIGDTIVNVFVLAYFYLAMRAGQVTMSKASSTEV
ncbi:MAG: hypothetical protein ACFFFO_17805 [Candidatus Thorarchaeota archaeon]